MIPSTAPACMLSHFSPVQLCVTPWTVAHQAPLSTGFSRQEYWRGLPCPPPGDFPDPGTKPMAHVSWAQLLLKCILFTITNTSRKQTLNWNKGLPGGAGGKESACQCRRRKRWGFSPGVGKIPWRRTWQPTPAFLPEEIPRTGEPGELQLTGSQGAGHDWSTWAAAAAAREPANGASPATASFHTESSWNPTTRSLACCLWLRLHHPSWAKQLWKRPPDLQA